MRTHVALLFVALGACAPLPPEPASAMASIASAPVITTNWNADVPLDGPVKLLRIRRGTVKAWAPNRPWVALSVDNTIEIWDESTSTLVRRIQTSIAGAFGRARAAFSPSSRLILITGERDYAETIEVWDTGTGERVALTTLPSRAAIMRTDSEVWGTTLGDTVQRIAWSPRGDVVAILCAQSGVRLFNPTTGTLTSTLRDDDGPRASLLGLAWSPSGDALATTDWDGTTAIHASPSGQWVRTMHGPRRTRASAIGSVWYETMPIAWRGDGAELATLTETSIEIFDVATGNLVAESKPLAGMPSMSSVVWRPDGHALFAAVGFSSKGLYTWDPTEAEMHPLLQMGTAVGLHQRLVISPNGKRLLFGADAVVFGDTSGESFRFAASLGKHDAAVWSNDLQWIATGDNGNTDIWHVRD